MLLSRRYLTLLQPSTGQLRSWQLPAQGDQWEIPHVAIDQQGAMYFDQNNILFRFTDQQGIRVVARWDQPNDACSSLLIDRTNVSQGILWQKTVR